MVIFVKRKIQKTVTICFHCMEKSFFKIFKILAPIEKVIQMVLE